MATRVEEDDPKLGESQSIAGVGDALSIRGDIRVAVEYLAIAQDLTVRS